MNLIKSTLIATAAVISLSGAAFAQDVAKKIVTVDMEKIFNDYHKTRSYQVELNKMEEEIKVKNEERLTAVKEVETKLSDMAKKVQDASISDENRQKIAQEFELEKANGQALEQDRQRFLQGKMTALEQRKRTIHAEILADIYKVVESKAVSGGFDLILDKSASSAAGTRVVAYSSSTLEITDTVLVELNKDAPAAE